MKAEPFTPDLLKVDCACEVERIGAAIRDVLRRFKKKGVIVALSGGVDSSVVGSLAVRALGPGHVFGLLMPERDSAAETLPLSQLIVRHLGIQSAHEDISGILEAAGCYRRRDDAIKKLLPDFEPGWKSKIVLPSLLESDQFRLFSVVAESPAGVRQEARLTLDAYLGIVAATA